MTNTTMTALEVTALTGPEAMRPSERPIPEPGPDEVLIKVEAAGVNFADAMQTRGLYVGGPKPPFVAGLEACGEVVTGDAAGKYQPGARVMGFGPAAFAEYVAWPARGLLPLPTGWTAGQGASFPIQWLTAHGCLRICGRLQAGDTVLIHAAAGGVGSAAITLAKHYGARVIGTASTAEKLEKARRLGADVLINYREQDFVAETLKATDGRGVDLILEMVGGETFQQNMKAVRPYGRIVVFGAATAQQSSVDNVSLIFQPLELIGYHLVVMATRRPDLFGAQLAEMQRLMAEGVVLPPEPTSYPLAEGSQALQDLEGRRTTGKLVLIP